MTTLAGKVTFTRRYDPWGNSNMSDERDCFFTGTTKRNKTHSKTHIPMYRLNRWISTLSLSMLTYVIVAG